MASESFLGLAVAEILSALGAPYPLGGRSGSRGRAFIGRGVGEGIPPEGQGERSSAFWFV